ncbi:hypothetical protein GT347_09545 [Xylophilus rhododendri]|uniref:Uncharacterized protein n=1 Tax=Xylophilus rhododendri TaxID=2697032 RepID=A0A857J4S2_9BURK|nr:hypothetical protein [Xylophilus rhododendri]QHI98213.1 hypothetical protein GT347_09545 [Xylophilus rhododendri]
MYATFLHAFRSLTGRNPPAPAAQALPQTPPNTVKHIAIAGFLDEQRTAHPAGADNGMFAAPPGDVLAAVSARGIAAGGSPDAIAAVLRQIEEQVKDPDTRSSLGVRQCIPAFAALLECVSLAHGTDTLQAVLQCAVRLVDGARADDQGALALWSVVIDGFAQRLRLEEHELFEPLLAEVRRRPAHWQTAAVMLASSQSFGYLLRDGAGRLPTARVRTHYHQLHRLLASRPQPQADFRAWACMVMHAWHLASHGHLQEEFSRDEFVEIFDQLMAQAESWPEHARGSLLDPIARRLLYFIPSSRLGTTLARFRQAAAGLDAVQRLRLTGSILSPLLCDFLAHEPYEAEVHRACQKTMDDALVHLEPQHCSALACKVLALTPPHDGIYEASEPNQATRIHVEQVLYFLERLPPTQLPEMDLKIMRAWCCMPPDLVQRFSALVRKQDLAAKETAAAARSRAGIWCATQ